MTSVVEGFQLVFVTQSADDPFHAIWAMAPVGASATSAATTAAAVATRSRDATHVGRIVEHVVMVSSNSKGPKASINESSETKFSVDCHMAAGATFRHPPATTQSTVSPRG